MAIHTFPIANNPLSKNNRQDINMNSNPKTVKPAPISNKSSNQKLNGNRNGNDERKERKLKITLYICQPDHTQKRSFNVINEFICKADTPNPSPFYTFYLF